MKKLWIVRHAKSSWSDYSLPDHDRPLNKRGKRDAPFMAKHIAENHTRPELLLSSTANRAYTTCLNFKDALGLDEDSVVKVPELYHASIATCLDIIKNIDEKYDVAAIFGHNPTFTYLIHELTAEGPDNHPTCGCALISSDVNRWKHFTEGNCEISKYLFPKQFFKNG